MVKNDTLAHPNSAQSVIIRWLLYKDRKGRLKNESGIGKKTAKKLSPLEGVVDVRHGPSGLLPEGDEGVLVQDERVREHVASKAISKFQF